MPKSGVKIKSVKTKLNQKRFSQILDKGRSPRLAEFNPMILGIIGAAS